MKRRLLAIMIMLSASGASQAQMAKDDLLDVLRQAEHAIQNFRFSLELRQFAVSEDGRESEMKFSIQSSGIVATGVQCLFRVHTRSKQKDSEGGRLIDAGIPNQYQGSYDGSRGKELYYEGKMAEELGGGVVQREPNTGNTLLDISGMEMLLPFYLRMGGADPVKGGPTGLVHLLENLPPEHGEWRVEATDSASVLRIIVPHERPGIHERRPGLADVIDVDLSKGGSIVRCALWRGYGTAGGRPIVRGDDIVLEEHDGVWLPVSLAKYYDFKPPYVMRTTIRYDAVNETLSQSDFDLEFPEGVTVYDEIVGTHYTVGLDEEARKELLSQSLDELAEVRGEAPAEGSTPTPPSPGAEDAATATLTQPGHRWGAWMALIAVCAGVALAAAGAVVVLRKRQGRRS